MNEPHPVNAPSIKKRKISETYSASNFSQSASAVSSTATKLDTLKRLGLEISIVPSGKIKTNINGDLSSNLKNSTLDNPKWINLEPLIEKFVSTLNSAITETSNKKIISKFYDLRKKCQVKYLHSKDFESSLNSALEKINSDPSNLYIYIKDVYDEMKLHRVKTTFKTVSGAKAPAIENESSNGNEKEIHRLEKLLEKLHRAVKKLKKKEVSLDEMDSRYSSYVYEDKLTKRILNVWKKLSKLKQHSSGLNSRKKINFTASKYPELNSKIEDVVNSSKDYPDFVDILQVTRSVNENAQLNISETGVQVLAQEAFQDIGKELKKHRNVDYQDFLGSYTENGTEVENDPADSDPVLKDTLEKSYIEGQNKFQKVLKDFTEKQTALKLEPKEVSDKYVKEEADYNSDSDDDEEDRAIEEEQKEEEMYSDDDVQISSSDDNLHSDNENKKQI